ncbi:hypothetical protein BDW22DRAFT_1351600 [Trametopsis cervina]|nr:hypothetical protein BDW22DRAFT_1351600 [Trametopsis cervina]
MDPHISYPASRYMPQDTWIWHGQLFSVSVASLLIASPGSLHSGRPNYRRHPESGYPRSIWEV